MAAQHSRPVTPDTIEAFPFPRGARIYAPHPDATPSDFADHLETRLAHLSALLDIIHGVGNESFTQYTYEIQDNVLWLCASLADECGALYEQTRRIPAKRL